MILTTVLVVVALAFVGYALVVKTRQDTTTPGSTTKKVWGALVAAAATLGALVMSWFSSGGSAP